LKPSFRQSTDLRKLLLNPEQNGFSNFCSGTDAEYGGKIKEHSSLRERFFRFWNYVRHDTVRNPNERGFSGGKSGMEDTNLEWTRNEILPVN
jgi:hypothetical protein